MMITIAFMPLSAFSLLDNTRYFISERRKLYGATARLQCRTSRLLLTLFSELCAVYASPRLTHRRPPYRRVNFSISASKMSRL